MNLKELSKDSRTIWVLISHDNTHIMSLPDGSPDWSYDKTSMELRLKIAKKDFKRSYELVTAQEALIRISNKQAELERLWAKPLATIRDEKSLDLRLTYYKQARHDFGPHPISADNELRKLLSI